MNFRGPKGAVPQEIGVFSNLYNPKLLGSHVEGPPKLIWPSLRHEGAISELDSQTIPKVDLISKRRSHNRGAGDDAQLLGCVVFWEVVRRSRLVFIFDPHMSVGLMRRLRRELTPTTTRGLETLLLIGGTQDNGKCRTVLAEIENAYAKVQRVPKIFYLDGMKSNEAPFPHDRFAVTDGEFWHFGGTAGGIEQCLTAVSRGWKAKDVGIQAFIDEAWSLLSNKQKVNA
ncbi:hypothetical protein QDD82_005424 [Burkholderia cepacia]|uniref:hypothetical protein n=1 Tax=Burkholderia cepacia complex TaxID=87882 RepID=UPI001588FD5F|nr:hypothetical protein [Burkholderia cenocepacia]EKS9844570.1 hypothetical protein [Burkholderia cepacia]